MMIDEILFSWKTFLLEMRVTPDIIEMFSSTIQYLPSNQNI